MEYFEFEQQLRSLLGTNNGPKLLYKLIESPYRYFSTLNPFNFKTKMEQSFLRSQENKYFKFIKDYADRLFFDYKYTLMENRVAINEVDQQNPSVINKTLISFSHLFKDENNKKMYAIIQKKRDIYSASESIKNLEVLKSRTELLSKAYPEYEVVGVLWFTEIIYRKNEEFYHTNTTIAEDEKFNYMIKYGSELFELFNNREDWEIFETYLERFKANDYKDFLLMPDLDSDPATLDAMVKMSNPMWEKLSSINPIYKQIRTLVFNEKNPKSNYLKAFQLRAYQETSIDDDEYKNKVLNDEFNKTQSEE